MRSIFYEALSETAAYFNERADKHQEFTLADEQLDIFIEKLKEFRANLSYYIENTEKLLDMIVEVRMIRDDIEGRLDRKVIRPERIKDGRKVLKFTKELENDIEEIINKQRRKKVGEKAIEISTVEQIEELPKVEHPKTEKSPENLIELFESLDIELSEQLRIIMEIIDEQYLQSISNNKVEYLALLSELKRNVEERISRE